MTKFYFYSPSVRLTSPDLFVLQCLSTSPPLVPHVLPACYIWPISGDHRAKVVLSPSLILHSTVSPDQKSPNQPARFTAVLSDLPMGGPDWLGGGRRGLWFP